MAVMATRHQCYQLLWSLEYYKLLIWKIRQKKEVQFPNVFVQWRIMLMNVYASTLSCHEDTRKQLLYLYNTLSSAVCGCCKTEFTMLTYPDIYLLFLEKQISVSVHQQLGDTRSLQSIPKSFQMVFGPAPLISRTEALICIWAGTITMSLVDICQCGT